MPLLRVILLLWVSFFSISVCAHQFSTAYLQVKLDNKGQLAGEWQVRLYDLEQAIGVDTDGDGKLRWQELQSRAEVVTEYLSNHVNIYRADRNCTLVLQDEWKIDKHFNEAYLLVPLRVQCALAGDIALHYNAFFENDSQHKLLLTLMSANGVTNKTLDDNQRDVQWDAAAGDVLETLVEFIYQGMVHIWAGFDHILFLGSLLLTSVLVRINNRWQLPENNRQSLINTTWIVTAFTIAHSITLTLAALDIIFLPSAWVEVAIAASVIAVALNNIFSVTTRVGWVAFVFGLLHGMGFAGVLGELGLPADQQLLTVFAFNIGVEFGQLAIVLLVLPCLMLVRNHVLYRRYSVVTLSALIALIGLQWLVQRWPS